MKLISLNTWGGRAGRNQLLSFFENHAGTTDIFCLQEILSSPYKQSEKHLAGGRHLDYSATMVNGLQDISAVLAAFSPYFRPHFLDNYGLLLLIHQDVPVLEEGEFYVFKDKGHYPAGDLGMHARNVQYVTLDTPNGPRTILNFHGLWNGQGKEDSPDRLSQSQRIIDFISNLQQPYILCGDFNLLPTTSSLHMLEDIGLRNLITDYKITSTRSRFYTKEPKFADYALVSPGIEMEDFEVLPDEVSDHLALRVTFT